MSDNSKKTPLASTLNRFAEKKVADAIQLLGKALPCSVVSKVGSIITVKFEMVTAPFTLPNVTIPMFGPEYVRYPIQPGDLGIVIPADVYIGGVSGLGGGTAGYADPANLSSLVFLPISNTAWSEVDPNAVTEYGPNGVVLRDTASRTTYVLLPTGLTIVGETYFDVSVNGTRVRVTDGLVAVTALNTTFSADVHIQGNLTVQGVITGHGGMAIDGGSGAAIMVTGSIETTGEVTAAGIPLSTHVHPGVQSGGSDTGTPIP